MSYVSFFGEGLVYSTWGFKSINHFGGSSLKIKPYGTSKHPRAPRLLSIHLICHLTPCSPTFAECIRRFMQTRRTGWPPHNSSVCLWACRKSGYVSKWGGGGYPKMVAFLLVSLKPI